MKLLQETRNRSIDSQTKEMVSEEIISTYQFPKEDDFIKLYLKDLCEYENLPTGIHRILTTLVKLTNYDNQIILNAGIKRQIGSKLKTSVDVINHAITALVKKQLLIRLETGIYLLNPYQFGKGSWHNICKIRTSIEYTRGSEERIFDVEFDKEEEQ